MSLITAMRGGLRVLKSIYSHGAYSERALGLHLAAPLLEERERFLQHLRREGATQRALKRVEQGLIKTIRCFRLKNLRDVELCEVHRACSRWQGRRRAGWTPDFSTMPSPPFLAPGKHAPAAALSKTQLPTGG